MSQNEQIEAAEQALYKANCTFRALRSVAFLLGQAEGRGPFDWEGQPMEDLEKLLDVLAQGGVDLTRAALDEILDAPVETLQKPA